VTQTARDYPCGECGSPVGSPCQWAEDDLRPGLYHCDRKLRFVQSVNRQLRVAARDSAAWHEAQPTKHITDVRLIEAVRQLPEEDNDG
jgi:hypothetical protein